MNNDRSDTQAGINEETRRQLIILARRPSARGSSFTPSQPTDWRPGQVRNPGGGVDKFFTNTTAWELIASRLEAGEEVKVVPLNRLRGAKAYAMLIDLGSEVPKLYVKLQLGPRKILGRSFHYTEHD